MQPTREAGLRKPSILRRLVRFLTPRQFRRPLTITGDAAQVPPHERRHATEQEMVIRDRQRLGRL